MEPTIPTWTPIVQSSWFDGIRTDMLTTSTGIISCVLIVMALGLIVAIFSRR